MDIFYDMQVGEMLASLKGGVTAPSYYFYAFTNFSFYDFQRIIRIGCFELYERVEFAVADAIFIGHGLGGYQEKHCVSPFATSRWVLWDIGLGHACLSRAQLHCCNTPWLGQAGNPSPCPFRAAFEEDVSRSATPRNSLKTWKILC